MLFYLLLVALANLAVGFVLGRYLVGAAARAPGEREIIDSAASRLG